MESTLGKRIAAFRKGMGLTQEQLADQLGITAQAVSKWENDQSCPDISVLPLLADIFGVSTDILLGRIQIPATIESDMNTDKSFNDGTSYDDTQDTDCGTPLESDENRNNDCSFRKKHFIDTGKLYLFGTAAWLLSVGVLFLLSKIFSWNCTLWDILWPCFLLVFGIFGLIRHISLFWMACSSVGAFFLISNIIPMPVELDKGILWAIIIILCGIMLLLDTLRKKRHRKVGINQNSHASEYRITDNFLTCSNSFGEENQYVIADRLDGGKISNSFGEYKVDLSGVESVGSNCTVDVNCSFGELILLVPQRFVVVHKSSKSFASFSVTGTPANDPVGEIHLRASVSFGEITVRYI